METKVNVPARDSLETVGVGIPLDKYGQNTLWFTGVCAGGSQTWPSVYTGPSNVISAYYRQPQAPGRCTTAVLAAGTKWVFGCGTQDCNAACLAFGLTCNQAGMRQVTTKTQAQYLARLNNLPVTEYVG